MKTLTITSAIELTASQLKELVSAVEKKYGKVSVNQIIDPSVIGGVSVTIDSVQIDATVAHSLQQLRQSIR